MTIILAIETSCDETAAAVIENGYYLRSNVVASQIELHRRYGGVFPEVASRQHILTINTVIHDALTQANVAWPDLNAIAVTQGPGLAGSLLVGVNTAKGLSLAQELPLIGINHLEGHLCSTWVATEAVKPDMQFPILSLIVSGGHTQLVLTHDYGRYQILGHTIDDAAGEAFDKIARLLGLGYPGGPAIQAAAKQGNSKAYPLPRAKTKQPYDFSFSGLKTAVLRLIQPYTNNLQKPSDMTQPMPMPADLPVEDLAASMQAAVVDALVTKTKAAAEAYQVQEVHIVGGVSANQLLREEVQDRLPYVVRIPPLFLCTDNAAMIGAAAYLHYIRGNFGGLDMDVLPSLQLEGYPA